MKDIAKKIHSLLDQLAYEIICSDRPNQKAELLLERVDEAKLQIWMLENLIKNEEEAK